MSNLPAYNVEKSAGPEPKEPVIVWENESSPQLRLVVTYTKGGNPPRAILERCDKKDAVGNEVWLEIDNREAWFNVKDVILKALAIASAQDYDIMEN